VPGLLHRAGLGDGMRVRKQDGTGDMSFGRGQADYWINVPDGSGQVAKTRLALWLGQWFLDRTDGTAWQTKVLGKYTGSTRDAVIRARMLGTPGLTAIAAYSSALNRETRGFDVTARIETAYGQTIVSGTF